MNCWSVLIEHSVDGVALLKQSSNGLEFSLGWISSLWVKAGVMAQNKVLNDSGM